MECLLLTLIGFRSSITINKASDKLWQGFSLGSTRNNRNRNDEDNNNNNSSNQIPPPESWYLDRNEEQISSYNKGFELWNQQQGYQAAVGLGGDDMSMRSGGRDITMMMSGSSGGSGSISCQDCGNQAKKDCVYMRCRTCCKSRGFDCATHVKSTWVPASVRRERHQKFSQSPQGGGEDTHTRRFRRGFSSSSSLLPPHLATTTNNPPSLSGMEVGNFPAEVSSQAVFKGVRVSSVDDTDDEYAYQTAVRIGGHIFKGILYDQGPDHHYQTGGGTYMVGESSSGIHDSSGGGGDPPLNLGAGPTSGSAMAGSSSPPVGGFLDPSLYPVSLSSYMPPGTQFFPHPRP